MILPDGTRYPQDYTCETRLVGGRIAYRYDWNDATERDKYMIPIEAGARSTRSTYPYDDHPVVRAHRALVASIDMRDRSHREMYLSFLAVAIPSDDYDVIASQSGRIVDAIQEANRMEDLESMLARLDRCERRQEALDAIQSDDARAQGDAMARHGHGSMTVQVER
jgi:hypothetical protein